MKQELLFGYRIDNYFDDIVRDLEALTAIPSVCDTQSPDKPFGRPCRDALAWILKRAQDLGLETVNTGNFAGHASYGSGTECIDVLTHLDVVPAGDGWDTDPFTAVKKGNRLYGRGTADDKGAAVAALYCLKALKDAQIPGSRKLRAVFGCGEEIGSNDLDIYYAQQGLPVMGFTPDCAYGICYAEKGILRIDLSAARPDGCILQSFTAGTAVNSVPSTAVAEILCDRDQLPKLQKLAEAFPAITLSQTEASTKSSVKLHCSGKAAHGAEPELGINAASHLIQFLHKAFSEGELGPLFTFAAEKIALEYNGSSLGIQMSDEPSGPLTLNLGIVSAGNGQDVLSLDIRYPVTADKEQICSGLREAAAPYQVIVTEAGHVEPLYIPKDTPLVSTLMASYEAAAKKPCTLYSTGGGTYARHCNNTVTGFGPIFPEQPGSNAHGPNEFIDLEYFRLHCRVCLEALYRMFTGKTGE